VATAARGLDGRSGVAKPWRGVDPWRSPSPAGRTVDPESERGDDINGPFESDGKLIELLISQEDGTPSKNLIDEYEEEVMDVCEKCRSSWTFIGDEGSNQNNA
jgi:hypothetical protein